MPMRSCRAVASRRESTERTARAASAHRTHNAREPHALAHARAAPSVSDGRRRCSHGVYAVWPCVAPPTWSRSQEYTSSIAESPSRRVRGRATSVAGLILSGTAGEAHRRTLPGRSPHRETHRRTIARSRREVARYRFAIASLRETLATKLIADLTRWVFCIRFLAELYEGNRSRA